MASMNPELARQIGSGSALPLLASVSLMLELLQLLASLLLNLLSNILAKTTTTSTSKPWRILTLNLEGQMDIYKYTHHDSIMTQHDPNVVCCTE